MEFYFEKLVPISDEIFEVENVAKSATSLEPKRLTISSLEDNNLPYLLKSLELYDRTKFAVPQKRNGAYIFFLKKNFTYNII